MSKQVQSAVIFVLAFICPHLVPSIAAAASHLDDVACLSSTSCIAVGAADPEAEPEQEEEGTQAQARAWSGSAWSSHTVNLPEGATESDLNGVSCLSSTNCTAVGTFVDGSDTEEENKKLALIMKWGGSSWTPVSSVPVPEGAFTTRLTEVACTSTTACIAVGSYGEEDENGEEIRKALAMRWNGTAWSLQTVPQPSGAQRSELHGISCTEASNCVAVGSFVNSSQVTKTLATIWNGTAWSIASTPEPSGAELSQLKDVSCRPSEACTAVGQYFTSTGDQKTLALRRNTTGEWSIQSTPNQSGALTRLLTAVSCSSSTACRAVGVVEQGRKELPIVIAWNGTSWSEQAIDSEALGASRINLTSVSCISSSECNSTGSVSYGRSAAPRDLAFRYNGTAWLVTEEGDYERNWVSLDTMERTSELTSLSCPQTWKCVAVGRMVEDSGENRNQVATWASGSWEFHNGPQPSDATSSHLAGVSCASFTSCWAVGNYVDDEKIQRLLAMKWDGEGWELRSIAGPAGAKAATLYAVDCASSSSCVAVGTYADAEEKEMPLAMVFNGSSWSETNMPVPVEATGSFLAGVSCASSSWCMAVGAQEDAFGHEESFAARWDGSLWTVVETPLLEGAAPNRLRGVSCVGSFECHAIGNFDDALGATHGLAFAWDGSKWTDTKIPMGESTELAAISCPAASSCVTVGRRVDSSTIPPLLLRWDGSSWDEEPPADFPAGTSAFSLMAVSCLSVDECSATGSAAHGGLTPKSAVLAYDTGGWFMPDSTTRGGGLRGVSCLSAANCVAIGDSVQPAGNGATAWIHTEDDWVASQASSEPGAYLTDMTCLDEGDCRAIGRQFSWPFAPLVRQWDGEAWNSQSIAALDDRSANLEGITCPSASYCLAVGFSWPEAGSGPPKPLVERWLGSGWTTSAVPIPAAAVSAFLHDISCASSSACFAVGSYTDSAGTSHGFVERWDGSSWTQSSVSPPSGQSYRVRGIDCTSSNACTAVGTTRSETDGTVTAIARRWNGTSWSAQTVPMPSEGTDSALLDVDCFSSTRCVAAGSYSHPAATSPFVAAWKAGTWAVEQTPAPLGGGHSVLESISCPTVADCVAAGMIQSPGRSPQPFTIQTEGEDVKEETDPVNGPNEPVLSLTEEQKEDAIELVEEDPSFQAAVGAANYEISAYPWTESSENYVETLTGAYIEVKLEKTASWSERAWPTTGYDLGSDGYEYGQYTETAVDAAASGIEELAVCIDLTFDSEANVIEGEVVELFPDSIEGGGNVTVDPEDTEYDKQVARY